MSEGFWFIDPKTGGAGPLLLYSSVFFNEFKVNLKPPLS